jgi:hypothetical protein
VLHRPRRVDVAQISWAQTSWAKVERKSKK